MDCAANICKREAGAKIPVNLTSAERPFLASNFQRNSGEFWCLCKPLKAKSRQKTCRKLYANGAEFHLRGCALKAQAVFERSLILSGLFVFPGWTRVSVQTKTNPPKKR